MQKVRIELTDLNQEAADRLIQLLHLWVSEEPSDIRLEVLDSGSHSIKLPEKGGQTLLLPLDEIHYILSDRHWTIFNLGEDSKRFRINFSEADAMLPENEFLNCSRGITLNMNHILRPQSDRFIMDDGAAFPIRRNGRKEILLRFEQFRLWKNSQ